MLKTVASIAGALLTSGLLACGGRAAPPVTKMPEPRPLILNDGRKSDRSDVVEVIHGVRVEDPYRWMESPDRAVDLRRWLEVRAERTRRTLDALSNRAALRDEILRSEAEVRVRSRVTVAREVVAFVEQSPGQRQPVVRVQTPVGERTLLDPGKFDEWRADSVDVLSLSPDGARIGVGVSRRGDEDVTLRILDVATGRALPDVIQHVVPGDIAWLPDRSGVIVCRRNFDPASRPEKDRKKGADAYLHRFTDHSDRLVMGPGYPGLDDFTEDDSSSALSFPDSPYVVGVRQRGVQQQLALYTRPLATIHQENVPWKRVLDESAGVTDAVLIGDKVFAISGLDAPMRKIMEYGLTTGSSRELPLLRGGLLERIVRSEHNLYISARAGNQSRLARYDVRTERLVPIEFPANRAVGDLVGGTRAGAVALVESWTNGPAWSEVRDTDAAVRPMWGSTSTPAFDGVEVRTLSARASDGTSIPITWLAPAGRSSSSPVWMFAYGSYGESLQPKFVPFLRSWFAHGGAIAYAHVRGGGEFGEPWHTAAVRENKHVAVSDFLSCADKLLGDGYATRGRLVASAASAGGVTVGRAALERPELFAAVMLSSAIANPLRLEQTPLGTSNISEFGSIASAKEFAGLLAVDAYSAVQPGRAYPAFMLMLGLNDARVPAWQSAKLAARLEDASASSATFVRVDADSGHTTVETRRVDKYADMLAFLLWRTGTPGFQPVPHPL